MHSPPNLHQLKSERTRERLLDAAVALLQEKGDGSISLQEVARAAGLTTGAVQHHFPSKIVLRMAVLARLMVTLEQAGNFWPDPRWSLQRRARHFVQEAWVQFYAHPRFCAGWAAYLAASADEQTRSYIVEHRAPFIARIHAQIVQAFPELAGQDAQIQCILATLRGMGLAVPFSPPGHFDALLDHLVAVIEQACSAAAATPAAPTRAAGTRGRSVRAARSA